MGPRFHHRLECPGPMGSRSTPPPMTVGQIHPNDWGSEWWHSSTLTPALPSQHGVRNLMGERSVICIQRPFARVGSGAPSSRHLLAAPPPPSPARCRPEAAGADPGGHGGELAAVSARDLFPTAKDPPRAFSSAPESRFWGQGGPTAQPASRRCNRRRVDPPPPPPGLGRPAGPGRGRRGAPCRRGDDHRPPP